ncbi:hypothetical protein GT579_15580, partial [Enterococcus durans]|nr:hypothetical protein [Enterococcus durans]
MAEPERDAVRLGSDPAPTGSRLPEDTTFEGEDMTLFRNLGPFHTTAIGHGEMPLTIE